MSLEKLYRPDMGFGGTAINYSNYKTISGERFIVYGTGIDDEIFLPDDENIVTVCRAMFDKDTIEAKYSLNGDLLEAGVWLGAYYANCIKFQGTYLDKRIARDISDITNGGDEVTFSYISLRERKVGIVFANLEDSSKSIDDAMTFLTKRDSSGIDTVVPLPLLPPDPNPAMNYGDDYMPGRDHIDLVKYSIDQKNLNILFRVNQEDYITQPFPMKIDLKFLAGKPTPKDIRDITERVFMKNIF